MNQGCREAMGKLASRYVYIIQVKSDLIKSFFVCTIDAN